MSLKTILTYPILLISSIEIRSFEALGRRIQKSGDTVQRLLVPENESFDLLANIARSIFANSKKLTLAIDDTLIQKKYAEFMEGIGFHFDTKLNKTVQSYKLLAAAVTNGKYTVPICGDFLYPKKLLGGDNSLPNKLDLVKKFILHAKSIFPDKKIFVSMDGIFVSEELLGWLIERGIRADLRMHSNRKIHFRGQGYPNQKIVDLIPRGRHMARSIQATWHDLNVTITADRRIDKHGEESIVYIVSTYKAKPIDHVNAYRLRWPIEKVFRTSKQLLGLKECFSKKLETQKNHVAAVFVAYAIAQWDMKIHGYKNSEKAIRASKHKNFLSQIHRLQRSDQIFGGAYA